MCAHSEHCSHAVKLTSDVSRLDTLMLCRTTFNVTWVCWRMGTHGRGGLKFLVMWMSLLAHGSTLERWRAVCSCEVGRAEYEFASKETRASRRHPFHISCASPQSSSPGIYALNRNSDMAYLWSLTRSPVFSHKSAPRFQYSHWAERIAARIAVVPAFTKTRRGMLRLMKLPLIGQMSVRISTTKTWSPRASASSGSNGAACWYMGYLPARFWHAYSSFSLWSEPLALVRFTKSIGPRLRRSTSSTGSLFCTLIRPRATRQRSKGSSMMLSSVARRSRSVVAKSHDRRPSTYVLYRFVT